MLGPILAISGAIGIVLAIRRYTKLLKEMDEVENDHFPRELDDTHENRVYRVAAKMDIALLLGFLAFITLIVGLIVWF